MKPSGYWWWRPIVCATRSAGSRLISFIDERPSRRKPSVALDGQGELGGADVVEGEAVVEQADERADGAGGVVVLGLAEQQRRAALDVAQVDVVAEGGAPDAAAAVDGEHDLGLGVVPARGRVQADGGAPADGRHRLALGEDLGVGADADLEVLAPEALGLERRLGGGGLGAARVDVAQDGADQAGDAGADRLGAVGVAGGALLDDALDHRAGEGDAAGLQRLQVAGGEQARAVGAVAAGRGDGVERADRAAGNVAHGGGRVVAPRAGRGRSERRGW